MILITVLDSERSGECIDFTMVCVLDSEESDECIDFTKMCFFFVLSATFWVVKMFRFSRSASFIIEK